MSRLLLGALVLLAAGCTSGGALPQTFPARGTVVYQNGKPMAGGSVEFTTTADPLLRVVGTVADDGTFTLTSVKDNARADGAPPGEYRVVVQPPPVNDPRGGVPGAHKGVPAITLPALYRLEAKENTDIKITLPAGP
jgi:hypothetical protein